jgi:hypothetical protein
MNKEKGSETATPKSKGKGKGKQKSTTKAKGTEEIVYARPADALEMEIKGK